MCLYQPVQVTTYFMITEIYIYLIPIHCYCRRQKVFFSTFYITPSVTIIKLSLSDK